MNDLERLMRKRTKIWSMTSDLLEKIDRELDHAANTRSTSTLEQFLEQLLAKDASLKELDALIEKEITDEFVYEKAVSEAECWQERIVLYGTMVQQSMKETRSYIDGGAFVPLVNQNASGVTVKLENDEDGLISSNFSYSSDTADGGEKPDNFEPPTIEVPFDVEFSASWNPVVVCDRLPLQILQATSRQEPPYHAPKPKSKRESLAVLNTCHDCELRFKRNKAFVGHRLIVHRDQRPYRCRKCQFSTKFKHALKKHNLTHIRPPTESDTGRGNPHSQTVADVPVDCDESFGKMSALLNRVIPGDKKPPFACSVCHATFDDKSGLMYHARTRKCIAYEDPVALQKILKIDELHRAFKFSPDQGADLKESIPKPMDRKLNGPVRQTLVSINCQLNEDGFSASKLFHEKSKLDNDHLSSSSSGVSSDEDDDHDPDFNILEEIKKSKTSKSRRGSSDKAADNSAEMSIVPFRCSVCQLSFPYLKKLKEHEYEFHRVSLKIFKCQKCDFITNQHFELMQHHETHVVSKPYRCKQCDQSFTRQGKLINHYYDHHPDEYQQFKDNFYATITGSVNQRDSDLNPKVYSGVKEVIDDIVETAYFQAKTSITDKVENVPLNLQSRFEGSQKMPLKNSNGNQHLPLAYDVSYGKMPSSIDNREISPFPENNDISLPVENHEVPCSVENHEVPCSVENHEVPRSVENHEVPRSVENLEVPCSVENLEVPCSVENLEVPFSIANHKLTLDQKNKTIPSVDFQKVNVTSDHQQQNEDKQNSSLCNDIQKNYQMASTASDNINVPNRDDNRNIPSLDVNQNALNIATSFFQPTTSNNSPPITNGSLISSCSTLSSEYEESSNLIIDVSVDTGNEIKQNSFNTEKVTNLVSSRDCNVNSAYSFEPNFTTDQSLNVDNENSTTTIQSILEKHIEHLVEFPSAGTSTTTVAKISVDSSWSKQAVIMIKNKINDFAIVQSRYECELCEMVFQKSEMFIAHMRADHVDSAKYHCELCDFISDRTSVMANHLYLHLNGDPDLYLCDRCPGKFKDSKSWTDHFPIHSLVAEIQCKICANRYRNDSSFIKHMMSHDIPCHCGICRRYFQNLFLLNEHYGSHSSEDRAKYKHTLPLDSTLAIWNTATTPAPSSLFTYSTSTDTECVSMRKPGVSGKRSIVPNENRVVEIPGKGGATHFTELTESLRNLVKDSQPSQESNLQPMNLTREKMNDDQLNRTIPLPSLDNLTYYATPKIPTMNKYLKISAQCSTQCVSSLSSPFENTQSQEIYTARKYASLENNFGSNEEAAVASCTDAVIDNSESRQRSSLNSTPSVGASFPVDLSVVGVESMATGSESVEYLCWDCPDKRYCHPKLLANHRLKIHGNVVSFKCQECPFQAKTYGIFQNHVRLIHTKEKPFICSICFARFPIKSHMIKHTRMHDNPLLNAASVKPLRNSDPVRSKRKEGLAIKSSNDVHAILTSSEECAFGTSNTEESVFATVNSKVGPTGANEYTIVTKSTEEAAFGTNYTEKSVFAIENGEVGAVGPTGDEEYAITTKSTEEDAFGTKNTEGSVFVTDNSEVGTIEPTDADVLPIASTSTEERALETTRDDKSMEIECTEREVTLPQDINVTAYRSRFLCRDCNEEFIFPSKWSEHRQFIHKEQYPFRCLQCGFATKVYQKFRKHDTIHLRPYKCDFCEKSKRFKSWGKLQEHVQKVHEKAQVWLRYFLPQIFHESNGLRETVTLTNEAGERHVLPNSNSPFDGQEWPTSYRGNNDLEDHLSPSNEVADERVVGWSQLNENTNWSLYNANSDVPKNLPLRTGVADQAEENSHFHDETETPPHSPVRELPVNEDQARKNATTEYENSLNPNAEHSLNVELSTSNSDPDEKLRSSIESQRLPNEGYSNSKPESSISLSEEQQRSKNINPDFLVPLPEAPIIVNSNMESQKSVNENSAHVPLPFTNLIHHDSLERNRALTSCNIRHRSTMYQEFEQINEFLSKRSDSAIDNHQVGTEIPDPAPINDILQKFLTQDSLVDTMKPAGTESTPYPLYAETLPRDSPEPSDTDLVDEIESTLIKSKLGSPPIDEETGNINLDVDIPTECPNNLMDNAEGEAEATVERFDVEESTLLHADVLSNDSVPPKGTTPEAFRIKEASNNILSNRTSKKHRKTKKRANDDRKRSLTDSSVTPPSKEHRNKISNSSSETTVKSFKCRICHKVYSQIQRLQNHVEKFHNSEKRKKCTVCGIKLKKKNYKKLKCSKCRKKGKKKFHAEDAKQVDKPFNCKVCDKSFDQELALKKHTSKFHKKSLDIHSFCTVCRKKFSSASNLNRHTRVYQNEKVRHCPICPGTFHTKSSLSKHLQVRHEEPPTILEDSDDSEPETIEGKKSGSLSDCATSSDNSDPATKIAKDEPQETLKRKWKDEDSPDNNLSLTTPVKVSKCNSTTAHQTDVDGGISETNLINEDNWILPENINIENDPTSLNDHDDQLLDTPGLKATLSSAETQMNNRELTCQECNLEFDRPKDFRSHRLSTHRDMKYYNCTYCDFSTAKHAKLRTHLNSHMAKNRVYKCQICQRCFRRSANLTQHKRVHNIETTKTFKCNKCDRSFGHPSNLANHTRRHKSTDDGELEKRFTFRSLLNEQTKRDDLNKSPIRVCKDFTIRLERIDNNLKKTITNPQSSSSITSSCSSSKKTASCSSLNPTASCSSSPITHSVPVFTNLKDLSLHLLSASVKKE